MSEGNGRETWVSLFFFKPFFPPLAKSLRNITFTASANERPGQRRECNNKALDSLTLHLVYVFPFIKTTAWPWFNPSLLSYSFLLELCLKLQPSYYLLVLCFLTHIVKSFESSPSQMMYHRSVKPDYFPYFLFSLMVRVFETFTFSSDSRNLSLLCTDLFMHLHSRSVINTFSYFLSVRIFFLNNYSSSIHFPSIEEAIDVFLLSLIQKRLL